MTKQTSLKRPLIILPLAFNFLALLVSLAILLAVALRVDSGGPYTDEQITPVIARAIVRRDDGSLVVRLTPELGKLRAASPDFWFIAENDAGRSVSLGRIPGHFASLVGRLPDFSYAQFRDRRAPYDLAAVIRKEAAPAGTLTILGHGRLTEPGFLVAVASNIILAPMFLLLVLTSLIVTPWIVRRSLIGIARIAKEAEEIDTDRRGRRLSEEHVPSEIAPLVRAMNDALRRLDEGYERQRRFIASAAHELRTPIAILRAKVDAASDPVTRSLGRDVQRLGTLAEQLLDLQRLDTDRHDEELNLTALVRQVVGDLAPLLIASERTIEVQIENTMPCRGDAAAIERVLTNLIQNAIEHGGRHVMVRVVGSAFEVQDNGPGIPLEERERVFEPFHRLRPRSTGSGLGLNLVQQVVDRHGGRVSIVGADGGGTIVRVELL
ncbi:HAMP domain-containing histidine kinase [Sphingomonas sp. UV9]|uniref:sensor histidine kinase n=1 Tax=Sphingomonas sp. UV9 TaxID=1851410 RepID=UPI000FFBEFE6|nr:HAMP domain-containing sensor histidine kinase [Sphingomonas sp. UV9]RXD04780.1 HAMP domain-containing histidine kinase [Sphingomonas sp. UV9]